MKTNKTWKFWNSDKSVNFRTPRNNDVMNFRQSGTFGNFEKPKKFKKLGKPGNLENMENPQNVFVWKIWKL